MIDTRRQTLLVRQPNLRSALIIGAGSTGSTAASILSRMGIGRISLWDDDILEPWNMSGGVFDRAYLGKPKVESVKSIVHAMSGLEIETHNAKFTAREEGLDEYDMIVVGVDSMEVRQMLWSHREAIPVSFWVDGRMGGHVCECFSVPMGFGGVEKRRWYDDTLWVVTQDLPCGTESTCYVVERLGTMIGNTFRAICSGETPRYRQYWDAELGDEFTSVEVTDGR